MATKHSSLYYLANVSTLQLSRDKCIGCGICEIVCPHRVFTILENKAKITDLNRCIECGACSTNCPVAAIQVKAGVGCAWAIINGWLTGKEASCDSSDSTGCC